MATTTDTPDPWACDNCGVPFTATCLPVARIGHNGSRHLLACVDCAPPIDSENPMTVQPRALVHVVELTAHVTVRLPVSVAAWIADQDIHLVEDGHNAGEREWREALRTATPRTGGIRLEISADAAQELAGELSERAEMEARMSSGHRIINPRTLRNAAEKIRAAIPA